MSLTAPSWHWRSLLLYGPHLRATTQDATPNCQSALPRDVRIRLAILGVSDQQAIKLAMQAEDASRDRTEHASSSLMILSVASMRPSRGGDAFRRFACSETEGGGYEQSLRVPAACQRMPGACT
jgi:hypothetical protein